MTKRALFVLTSCDTLGDTGNPTGFFWEEMAVPYWMLRDDGIDVDLASVAGGKPPADPGSDAGEGERPAAVQRFLDDETAMAALGSTAPIQSADPAKYDLIYLPGGHGTMWDLRQTESLGAAVASIYEAGGIVGAVCHGPAGLLGARLSDGAPLVSGRKVNGFTNAEEREAGLADAVPYLLEDALREQGAKFEKNDQPFGPHAVRDGRLVTGQNPASSERVGMLMLQALNDGTVDRAA